MNHYRPLGLVFLWWLCGCTNAATFTSARALPAGAIQHGPGLEIGAPVFPGPKITSCGDFSSCDRVSPQIAPSYSLNVGATDRVELGGKLALASVELSTKVQLVEKRHFALAVAPRGTLGMPEAFGVVRVPVLVTWQPVPRFSWTWRAGAGAIWGNVQMLPNDFDLASPLVEGGSVWMLQIAPTVWLALEASALIATNGTFVAPSGGFAFLFGHEAPHGHTQSR